MCYGELCEMAGHGRPGTLCDELDYPDAAPDWRTPGVHDLRAVVGS